MISIKMITDNLKSGSSRTKSVKKNALISLFIKVGAMILQLVQVPIVLSYLDSTTYGVYLTISSIVLWTHNFDLGLGQGLRYRLTEAISLKNVNYARALVSTAYISLSGIMLLTYIVAVLICLNINWGSLLQYYRIDNSELILCILIVLGSFLLRFVLDLICIVLQAHQLTAISISFAPIANLISVIGVLILKFFSNNSLLFACIMLSVPLTIVLLISNIVLFSKRYRQIAPIYKSYNRACLKDIYNLGMKFFISSLAGLVVFNTSSLLLSHYLDPTQTAVYQTAFMYMGTITTFMAVLSSPLMAGITDAYVSGEFNWLRSCFTRFGQITTIGSFGCILLLLISPLVYKIWLHGRLEIPFTISMALCVFFIGNLWSSMFNCFVTGAGKAHISMLIAIIKIILFLPVAIGLIKILGVVGLVIATILVNTLPNVIICYIQSKKIISDKASGIWNK